MARRSITFVDPRTMMRRIFRDDWDNVFNDFSMGTVSQYGINMHETDNHVIVDVEAPGYTPEQVDISIEDQTLTVSGHFKQESEEEEDNKKYHYREIMQQSFNRSVMLPVKVKSNEAEAEFNNGIITITLPKAEEVKPQKIAVKTKGSNNT